MVPGVVIVKRAFDRTHEELKFYESASNILLCSSHQDVIPKEDYDHCNAVQIQTCLALFGDRNSCDLAE
jgi:hypothetical protein